MHKRYLLLLAFLMLAFLMLGLGGCRQGPAAYDQLDAMLWTQTSIEKELIFHQVYAGASRNLIPALNDPQWDALPGEPRPLAGLPPAIIIDVDETLLTNTALSARDIKANREFSYPRWNRWVEQRQAPALPGALAFASQAQQAGITLFYVTNREHLQAKATFDNLQQAGFPIETEEQVLGANTPTGRCQSSGYDKTCRRQWVGQHYRVLMLIGDSFGDFIETPGAGLEAGRQAAAPYLGWLGERWFVLPNPTYGDWYSAPYGGDERLPLHVRRAFKHQALDVQQ